MHTKYLHFAPVRQFVQTFCIGVLLATVFSAVFAQDTLSKNKTPSFWEKDPRLQQSILQEANDKRLANALARMSEDTEVVLSAKRLSPDEEGAGSRLAFRLQNVRLCDVMDAIASLRDWNWVVSNKRYYLETPRYPARYETSEYHHLQREDAQKIVAMSNSLPQNLKKRLTTDYFESPTLPDPKDEVSLSELPEEMRNVAITMIQRMLQHDITENSPQDFRFLLADIGETKINLIPAPDESGLFTRYRLGFGVINRGGATFDIDDYEQRRKEWQKATQAANNKKTDGLQYTPELYQLPRKAQESNPILQQKVSVAFEKETLFQILSKLSAKYNFSFVMDSDDSTQVSASFSCSDLPLHQALDQLMETFSQIPLRKDEIYRTPVGWEQRYSGIIVVRGTRNSYQQQIVKRIKVGNSTPTK